MSLETATYISDLDTANPVGGDPRSTVDDHLRLIKAALKRTFVAITGEVVATQDEINFLSGLESSAQAQFDSLSAGKLSISATALTALSAVYAQSATNAVSSIFATSASNASNAVLAASATRATNAVSAVYAGSAGYAESALAASSAVFATSATNATNAVSAKYATSAGLAALATLANSASYALSAAYAAEAGDYNGGISVGQVDTASAGGRGLVELATDAETSAGASAALAITPASLLAGLGKSAATPGWIRLPGGIIVQWGVTGTVTTGSGTWVSSTASFPITFPNAFLKAVASLGDSADAVAGGYTADVLIDDSACTTSALQAYIRRGQSNGSFAANYIAIGY